MVGLYRLNSNQLDLSNDFKLEHKSYPFRIWYAGPLAVVSVSIVFHIFNILLPFRTEKMKPNLSQSTTFHKQSKPISVELYNSFHVIPIHSAFPFCVSIPILLLEKTAWSVTEIVSDRPIKQSEKFSILCCFFLQFCI